MVLPEQIPSLPSSQFRRGIHYFESMKLIFVHTPKTGGISVVSALRRHSKQWIGRYGHSPLCHTLLADPRFNREEVTVVAVARNPWDRLLSGYCYLMQGGTNRKDRLRKAIAMPILRGEFNDFVSRLKYLPFIHSPSAFYDIRWSPHLWPFLHIIPQHYWLHSADRAVILVDKVLRFENIENDVQRLVSERDVSGLELAHLNSSTHLHYQEIYSRSSIEIVRKIFQRDIEYFNYNFD